MSRDKAARVLEESGFSPEQLEALLVVFALHGHSHEVEDIVGLDEELAELSEAALGLEEA